MLDLLEDNLRRLRAIYVGVTAVGVALSVALAGYVYAGGELEGPVIVFAVLGPGVLLIGLALLLPRLRVTGSKIVRTLLERPERVVRVGLERTESTIAGARAASYEWVVLELGDRTRLRILVREGDLRGVLAEIRRCAPQATFDERWAVQRTDVSIS
ncbi:MAG: hypothetical protein IPM35_25175 [Myxococcales bacterium]|nr:hypothetical protein [Myxococcales bacterium]